MMQHYTRAAGLVGLLLMCCLTGQTQVVHLEAISDYSLTDTTWRYHPGDSAQWSAPNYDDRGWTLQRPYFRVNSIPNFDGIGWFRLRVIVDSALYGQRIGMQLKAFGAADIYWNSKQVHTWGTTAQSREKEKLEKTGSVPIALTIAPQDTQTLAVRYSNHHIPLNYKFQNRPVGFVASFTPYSASLGQFVQQVVDQQMSMAMFIQVGFLLAIGVVFIIYFFINLHKWNAIFFALFSLLSSFVWFVSFWRGSDLLMHPDKMEWVSYAFGYATPLWLWALLGTLYLSFYQRWTRMFIINTIIVGVFLVVFSLHYIMGFMMMGAIMVYLFLDSLRVIGLSFYKRLPGRWIIGVAIACFMLFFIMGWLFLARLQVPDFLIDISFVLSALSAPVGMAVYISFDYAQTNRQRIQKAEEKRAILANQREKLARQVEEQTQEIQQQKEKIEKSHRAIVSSIEYASRIQQAILPDDDTLEQLLPQHFVYYQPCDVVSGDFYWVARTDQYVIFTVADCTGHGVPGGFMSMIGNDLLNHIVLENGITQPKTILERLDEGIIQSLKQKGESEEVHDGMDMALCRWEPQQNQLLFAGAKNPLYLVRQGELKEYKGSRFPIGGYFKEKTFKQSTIQLKKQDGLYLFSDGYPDQFGGPKGKKFMYKRFRQLLTDIQDQSMAEQQQTLATTMQDWMAQNDEEQIDDICVLGIHISNNKS